MHLSGRIKSFINRAFYVPDSREFLVVNDVLSLLTILSVLSVILESVVELSAFHQVFLVIEWVAIIFFTLEYVGRIYVHPKPLRYVFSFFGLIDLLSILPSYLASVNLTGLKTVRMLRILRFLRVLRVSKIRHHELQRTNPEEFDSFGATFRLNALIYVTAVATATTIFGTLAYFFEPTNPSFTNIPRAMLWALEAFLGGSISSATTMTDIGLVIGLATRFTGLVLFAFLIHIVGNAVSYLLFGGESKNRALEKKDLYE